MAYNQGFDQGTPQPLGTEAMYGTGVDATGLQGPMSALSMQDTYSMASQGMPAFYGYPGMPMPDFSGSQPPQFPGGFGAMSTYGAFGAGAFPPGSYGFGAAGPGLSDVYGQSGMANAYPMPGGQAMLSDAFLAQQSALMAESYGGALPPMPPMFPDAFGAGQGTDLDPAASLGAPGIQGFADPFSAPSRGPLSSGFLSATFGTDVSGPVQGSSALNDATSAQFAGTLPSGALGGYGASGFGSGLEEAQS
jgi:hypothetical protein